ncbi:MAG TPA: Holliday junction branch migration protein RuvA [Candidatus Andersenbacteria bacterium]|nr:Holliday junction branch migration protein RuvA [Candidatus Andersenbacteria bacterium]
MIARIHGIVIEREEKALIIDVQGIGYRVFVISALREKTPLGSEVTFIIYDHRTDSDQVLFGFESSTDREYFELLLRVPSIGPKTALGVLDAAPIAVLSQAVLTQDMQLLTSLSGIGKRTAERIVVELKGKLGELPGATSFTMHHGVHQETADALIAIGFTVAQARQAVSKLPEDITTVEAGVKAALKQTVS